jgi:hypothetical protein
MDNGFQLRKSDQKRKAAAIASRDSVAAIDIGMKQSARAKLKPSNSWFFITVSQNQLRGREAGAIIGSARIERSAIEFLTLFRITHL